MIYGLAFLSGVLLGAFAEIYFQYRKRIDLEDQVELLYNSLGK